MKHAHVITVTVCALMLMGQVLATEASAKPKGSAKQCTTQDLNTNFGKSCNDQAQQDLMGNKPYYHLLICGGDTMLCCTFDHQTNQVQTCRKPAGARIMPGVGAVGSGGVVGLQSRGIEGKDPIDEEAPVPADLTLDVVKAIRKASAPK